MTSTNLNPSLPSGAAIAMLVSLAFGLLTLSGCSEEEMVAEELLPSVSVYLLQPRTLSEEIRASGDLEAQFHTEIAAEVDGRVTELAMDEGASVAAGAVVIEIDPERRQSPSIPTSSRLTSAWPRRRSAASHCSTLRRSGATREDHAHHSRRST